MEPDLQVSPEKIMSREVELACESWTSFASLRVLLNSSATDIVFVTLPSTAVETATAQCTSRWAMAREHRLNTSTILVAVHGLSGLFRRYPRSSLHAFVRPPAPDKPSRFCGRKAKCTHTHTELAHP